MKLTKEKLQSLLKERWAKDDGTTIREHTDKLLKNLEKLKCYYKKDIEELIPKELPCELRDRFWKILELACEYHDYGKIHCMFQKKVENKNIELIKGLPEVKHNLLSPAFVNVKDELTKKNRQTFGFTSPSCGKSINRRCGKSFKGGVWL